MRKGPQPHRKRRDAHGHVDEKDALPRKGGHDGTSQHGADHHAQGHERGKQAHGAPALARREGLGDDAHVVGHGGRAANALHNTRRDERRQRLGKAAQQRSEREDDHARLEHVDLATLVAQPAKRKDAHARGKQIHRRDPLNLVEPHAQLLLHDRKHHRHDARVEAHHERHDQRREQNRPLAVRLFRHSKPPTTKKGGASRSHDRSHPMYVGCTNLLAPRSLAGATQAGKGVMRFARQPSCAVMGTARPARDPPCSAPRGRAAGRREPDRPQKASVRQARGHHTCMKCHTHMVEPRIEGIHIE